MTPLPASLRETMTGISWRPGCPVGLDDLRLVRARHWGFDGRVHTGRIVVHRDVARDVATVLRRLYAARFPIRRMVPVDAYGGERLPLDRGGQHLGVQLPCVEGTSRWSEHAYGRAIDLNPIENPYVSSDGTTSHRASRPYLRRAPYRPGMAVEGGVVVRAFARRRAGRGAAAGRGVEGLPALLGERPLMRQPRSCRRSESGAGGIEPP